MQYTWIHKPFALLTTGELYAIMGLRQEVFVVEQHCPYRDADGLDSSCSHLAAFKDQEQCVATLRLVPPGLIYAEMSIGRVCTHPEHRGRGLARDLMQRGLALASELYGNPPVRISAQVYLLPFYRSLGFVEEGEVYYEDLLPHQQMFKPGP